MFGCQTAPDFTHRGCEGWMIEAAAAPSHPSLSLHPHLRQSRLWSLWPRAGWWEGLRCQPWLWVSWTQTAAPVCGDFYKVNVQFMFLRTTKTNSKPLVFVQKTKIYTKIKHRLFLRISHKNSVSSPEKLAPGGLVGRLLHYWEHADWQHSRFVHQAAELWPTGEIQYVLWVI